MKRSGPLVRKTPLKPGKGLKRSTKRMKQRHRAIGKPTREEQAMQDAQRAKGCAMCHLLLIPFENLAEGCSPCGVSEIHHRTVGDIHGPGSVQIGQGATVCLGKYHHQGVVLRQYRNADAMRVDFGPSLQAHKRDFLNLLQDNLGERSTAALQRYQEQLA